MAILTGEMKEARLQRRRAHAAVVEAIRCNEIPRADDLTCVKCGGPAKDYHHHSGYDREHWLDVVPMCKSCHRKENMEQMPRCQGVTLFTERPCRLLAVTGSSFCHYHQPKAQRVIIELSPDVAAVFPDAVAVNRALRDLIKLGQKVNGN